MPHGLQYIYHDVFSNGGPLCSDPKFHFEEDTATDFLSPNTYWIYGPLLCNCSIHIYSSSCCGWRRVHGPYDVVSLCTCGQKDLLSDCVWRAELLQIALVFILATLLFPCCEGQKHRQITCLVQRCGTVSCIFKMHWYSIHDLLTVQLQREW